MSESRRRNREADLSGGSSKCAGEGQDEGGGEGQLAADTNRKTPQLSVQRQQEPLLGGRRHPRNRKNGHAKYQIKQFLRVFGQQ